MRITIVTGAFLPLPPAPCGAVERLWNDLAGRFSARGHHVTILCRGFPGQARRESRGGVKYLRWGRMERSKYLGLDIARDGLYSARMCALLPRADILVTNTFWMPALAPSLRPGAGRVVVNVQRVPKGQLRLYGRAARLAAVSTAIRDDILAQSPRAAQRVRVIPNPIDAHVFSPPREPRLYNGALMLLYTGRLHPEKGVHLLIEAFARLLDQSPRLRVCLRVCLRLVGPGEISQGGGGPEYIRRLQALAVGLPVEIGAPIYNREALARELQKAHAYVYPSLADKGESFGVAPLEAMATGLAPIVSDLACFRDFVDDGRTGRVFDHRGPDAAASLCAAIKEALSDPERAQAMGHEAAREAQRFDLEHVARMYLDDFEELVSGELRC